MAEFQTFDLGSVLRTAEAIKSGQREDRMAGLQAQYLGQRTQESAQTAQYNANEEQRKATTFSQEQQLYNTRTLHVAAEQVAADPTTFPKWAGVLKNAGIIPADLDQSTVPPEQLQEQARQLAESSGRELQSYLAANPAFMEADYKHRLALEEIKAKKDAEDSSFTLGPGQQRIVNGKVTASVPPTKKGMRITSDGQGGFELYEGEGDGVDLGKSAQTELQKNAISAQSGLDRLAGIRQGFDPKWLTYKEQAKQYISGVKAKAQGLPFVSKLTPEEQSDLSAFSRFKSDTLDNLNRYIKEITGSAMGVEEAKRIVSSMPNMDDDGPSFQSKMDAVDERMRMVIARSVYTQKKGIRFDAMPIDQMRAVMNKRGEELYKQHLAESKDPAAAKAATVQALQDEFYK